MPNYILPKVTGATVFFTVALADRRSSLLVERIDDLREAVRTTRAERPFRIEAWVVLPDHFHCVWKLPAGDADFSTRMGAIKSRFSRACGRAGFTPPDPVGWENGGVNPALPVHAPNGPPDRSPFRVRAFTPIRRKGEVGLWQSRFWEHHIRDENDYRTHVRYCWINPVKHGYVARPEAWPFSSVHGDARYMPKMDLGM